MPWSTIRKAIGALKDQTTINMAKVGRAPAPELEVLVVKATSHDEDHPPGESHVRAIVAMISSSRGYVGALVAAVSRRVSRTSDWVVALKCLVLVHRVMVEGHASFCEEVVAAMMRGDQVLDLGDFRDEAHLDSWDHSSFVKLYAAYLEEKVGRSRPCVESVEPPMREMRIESVVAKLNLSLRLLDRILACRPSGKAKRTRLVIVAVRLMVRESFGIYLEVRGELKMLLDRFSEIGYEDGVKAFDLYLRAVRMINELDGLFEWCKEVGVERASEFPEVERVSNDDLVRLERLLKEMRNMPKRVEKEREVNALPPLSPPPAVESGSNGPVKLYNAGNENLVDLRSDWELVLVESAAVLPSRKAADSGDGLHPKVSQHGSTHSGVGPVLALPLPDGTVKGVGDRDVFAASSGAIVLCAGCGDGDETAFDGAAGAVTSSAAVWEPKECKGEWVPLTKNQPLW